MEKVRWKDLLLIVFFALCLWGGEYWRRKIWEPDEARFSYVAREMREDGHTFTPHKYGVFYAHKPPMFFWLTNTTAGFLKSDLYNITGRIPTFFGAVLTLCITWALSVRWFDRRCAIMAVLILASSYAFWHEGGMARMDSLLCGLEMTALYLLFGAKGKYKQMQIAGAYCCMGLAVLTKGPVGLLVPMVAYCSYSIARGDWGRKPPVHLLWGFLLALIFPALWFYGAYKEGAPAAYFHELIFKQNIARVAAINSFGKPQPFYYYLWQFPVNFLPWSVMVPISVAAYLRQKKESIDVRKYTGLLAWAVSVVVFFSLSEGKREIYILLAYPPMAIFVASLAGRLTLQKSKKAIISAMTANGVLFLLGLACIVAIFLPQASFLQHYVTLPSAIILITGSFYVARLILIEGMSKKVMMSMACILIANQICVGSIVYPAFNEMKTPPMEITKLVQLNTPVSEPLLMYRATGTEIVPLYCNRQGLTISTASQLDQVTQELRHGAIIFYESDWKELENKLTYIQKVSRFGVGNKRLYCAVFDYSNDMDHNDVE